MEYTREMKAALDYIEHHLNEHIQSADAADAAGFSKYHFHRIFKKETGLGIYEYIQRRRLSKAASLLLYTDMPVIDIALYFCFDSQEAFTRAFKRIYGMPPGRYRRALSKVINKEILGGNNMNVKNNNPEIPHWFVTGTAPDKYQAGIDQQIFHSGSSAMHIPSAKNTTPMVPRISATKLLFFIMNFLPKYFLLWALAHRHGINYRSFMCLIFESRL